MGSALNEKVDGKHKPRRNSALEKDIQASVCKAASEWEPTAQPSQSSALEWEPRAQPSQSSDISSSSRVDAGAVQEHGAEHGAAEARHAGGVVYHLSETPDDVLPNTLSRLGPNMYQATLRSGRIWLGNAELLRSLPHGDARLATLQTRERVAQAKAEAKMKAKTPAEPPRNQEEPSEPSATWRGEGEHDEAGASRRSGGAELHGASAKRQRTLRQMFFNKRFRTSWR